MDEVDEEIVSILREDARASFTDIADRIGVSEGTVRNRVDSLEEDGFIEKYTVKVNPENSISAFISVNVSADRSFDAITSDFPDNLDVYEVAGDIDLIVKVERDTSEEVNQVVDEIRTIEGVESTQTYMVLSEEN